MYVKLCNRKLRKTLKVITILRRAGSPGLATRAQWLCKILEPGKEKHKVEGKGKID